MTRFKYLGESGQWYEIEYNGGKAYVSKSYSQKTTAQGKYEYANNVLTDIQKGFMTSLNQTEI